MKYRRSGYKFLRNYIEERLNGKVDENGNKPDDLVQWLVDAAPPIERNAPMISERVMALNVASIHTTTMVSTSTAGFNLNKKRQILTWSRYQTFTCALYTLAGQAEKYMEPLRREVLENLEDGEISYNSAQKLPKMESFLRESGRFNNAGLSEFLPS